MMGRKTLAEIKSELGLSSNGKASKKKPTAKLDSAELEKMLSKQLAELEREVKKGRKPKARRPVKR